MTARATVLHLIDTTGPGGAETVFLQVAAGLRDRGWPPRMVVVGPGWVLDQVRSLNLPVDVVETNGRFDLSYIRRLHALVRRHGVGLIHAHLFSPAVYASAIGAWTGVPVAATFHGASDTVTGGLGRRLRFRLLERRAAIACVSEMLCDDLCRTGALAPEVVRVVHNGVDPTEFAAAEGGAVRREHGIPAGAILVGALGNIRPAKDFQSLLRAAAMLASDERLAFAIVGQRTDPLYSRLRHLRDELGLEHRVSFWGFRTDVAEVVSSFDVLVVSSESEGFSLAAIQAMAAGTPVVATRSGGPERIITDGVDGVLVAPRSPESLAAGIRRVVDDPAMASRMVEAARETVRTGFSLESMLDGYERLYEELTTRS